MFEIILSNQFKKDLKLTKKRGLDLKRLDEIIEKIQQGQPLPEKNRDHSYYSCSKPVHIHICLPDFSLDCAKRTGTKVCLFAPV